MNPPNDAEAVAAAVMRKKKRQGHWQLLKNSVYSKGPTCIFNLELLPREKRFRYALISLTSGHQHILNPLLLAAYYLSQEKITASTALNPLTREVLEPVQILHLDRHLQYYWSAHELRTYFHALHLPVGRSLFVHIYHPLLLQYRRYSERHEQISQSHLAILDEFWTESSRHLHQCEFPELFENTFKFIQYCNNVYQHDEFLILDWFKSKLLFAAAEAGSEIGEWLFTTYSLWIGDKCKANSSKGGRKPKPPALQIWNNFCIPTSLKKLWLFCPITMSTSYFRNTVNLYYSPPPHNNLHHDYYEEYFSDNDDAAEYGSEYNDDDNKDDENEEAVEDAISISVVVISAVVEEGETAETVETAETAVTTTQSNSSSRSLLAMVSSDDDNFLELENGLSIRTRIPPPPTATSVAGELEIGSWLDNSDSSEPIPIATISLLLEDSHQGNP